MSRSDTGPPTDRPVGCPDAKGEHGGHGQQAVEKVRLAAGFFAALDQSGGSTPKALAEYGIAEDRYQGESEMFDLVHRMRTRVVTSPTFDGSRVLGCDPVRADDGT